MTLTDSRARTVTLATPVRRSQPRWRWSRWSAAHPDWPLTALLAGYPVWWALGLGDLIFIFLAIPMLARMISWHRQGRGVRVPPAFGVWLLFLIVMLAGLAELSLTAPGTAASSVSSRMISFGDRSATYLAMTVLLLFAGNLTEQECSRRRLAWLLGLVGIYAVIGGLGGVVDSHLEFTSPLAHVLPRSAAQNTLVQAWMHPGFSQIQGVLGTAKGRPKAPFDYTDTWGNCVTILLPWLIVAWSGSRGKRFAALAVSSLAVVPILYSLDRDVWIGIAFSACYVAIRLAAKGRLAPLGIVLAVFAVVGVVVLATPLHTIITERMQHQNSNTIRSTLDQLSVRDAAHSPLIGYGGTRHMLGSPQSIALGPSPQCITCGGLEVGSTGQLWLLLVSNGFLGAVLYYTFFAYGIWRYRRDTTPYGLTGVLVLLLSFIYAVAYTAIAAPLAFTMVAFALLWRNDQRARGVSAVARAPAIPLRPLYASITERSQLTASAMRRRAGPLAEVARAGLFNLIGAGVAGLSTVAVTLIVTRSFTRAAAGAFFAATSLFLIVEAVCTLGAVPGTVYFIARLRSLGEGHRIPEVLRTALRPVVVVSVAAAIALGLSAPQVARILVHNQFGHAGAQPSQVAAALRTLAVALPFAALLDTLLGASRGFRTMAPTNTIDRVGRSLAQLTGIGVIAATSTSTALLAPMWALPYIPAACAAWLWLRYVRRRSARRIAATTPAAVAVRAARGLDREYGKGPLRFWRFTAPRGLALLAQVTIQRIDIVLVAIMRGPVEAAIYTAATRFLVAGQFAIQAIGMASQPRFTEMFARRETRGANSVYQATTAWLILLTWPLYLLAISFGPQILTVFGRSYSGGAVVMVILGFAMLLLTGCGLVDMVLVTTGRTSWSLMNGLLAVGVNVGLDLVLIPRYGITGAATGWAAAIAVTNLLPLIQLAVTVELQPFGRGTLIAAALTSVSFGVLPLATREMAGSGAVVSVTAVAGGCIVMAAGMWRFRDDLRLAALRGAPALWAGGAHRATGGSQ
jgi:O-antigen/teichoic acid export membrane protein